MKAPEVYLKFLKSYFLSVISIKKLSYINEHSMVNQQNVPLLFFFDPKKILTQPITWFLP